MLFTFHGLLKYPRCSLPFLAHWNTLVGAFSLLPTLLLSKEHSRCSLPFLSKRGILAAPYRSYLKGALSLLPTFFISKEHSRCSLPFLSQRSTLAAPYLSYPKGALSLLPTFLGSKELSRLLPSHRSSGANDAQASSGASAVSHPSPSRGYDGAR